MKYPSLKEVDAADRVTLCRWYRFLESPGLSALGQDNFNEVLEEEARIMNRIVNRWQSLGGFTPEISKAIGWEK